MASGRIQSASYGKYSVIIEWETVPHPETNSSTMTMRTYITYGAINISDRTHRTSIAGVEATYRTAAIDRDDGSPLLVNTRTMEVSHNAEGGGSVYIWSQFAFKLNSSSAGYVGEIRAGGWCDVDHLPRTSVISASSSGVTVNGENAYALTMEKAADAFRHKATLTFGDNVYVSDAFDTEFSYVIPVEWLNAIPTQMRSTADVSIQTYADETCETAVGDPVETTFEIIVPASPPVIADGWASVQPSNDGAAAGITLYAQSWSRALVTFDGDRLSAQYGASIEAVVAVIDGVNYNAAPYLSAVLNRAGQQTIRCIATDSRGQQSVQELTITVEAYAPPTLTGVSLIRCDADGTANDAGTSLYAAATANYSPVGGENFIALKVEYGPTGSDTAVSTVLESGMGKVVGSGMIRIDHSYTATITATDALGKVSSYTAVISTAYATFNAKPGGRGFAFGKYAEKNDMLDSAWDIHSDGSITADGTGSFAGVESAGSVSSGGEVNGVSGRFGDLAADGLTLPGYRKIVASETTLQLLTGDVLLAEYGPNGSAVGGASSATADDPKDEFHRKAVFHAGVDGILRYNGVTFTGKYWSDGKPIYTFAMQADGSWTGANNAQIYPFGYAADYPIWLDSMDVLIGFNMHYEFTFSSTGNYVRQDASAKVALDSTGISYNLEGGRVPVRRFVFVCEFTLK